MPTTQNSFSSEPFDIRWERLPPHYLGVDIRQVLKLKAVPAKGEFETTEQYRARVLPLPGDTFYGFALEPSDYLSLSSTYDADAQTLSVKIDPDLSSVALNGERFHNMPALILRGEELSERQYEGGNAFGATIQVSASHRRKEGLLPVSWPDIGGEGLRINLPVPLERAQSVKSQLKVLIVVRCESSPYEVLSGSSIAPPTLEAPIEIKSDYKLLRVALESIWFYSWNDGTVYSKTPL